MIIMHIFEAFTMPSGNGRVKKTASKRYAEAYPSILFQVRLVKVDNPIDHRMQSHAAPLYSYLMICLHSAVLSPHVILPTSIAIDLYIAHYITKCQIGQRCVALHWSSRFYCH